MDIDYTICRVEPDEKTGGDSIGIMATEVLERDADGKATRTGRATCLWPVCPDDAHDHADEGDFAEDGTETREGQLTKCFKQRLDERPLDCAKTENEDKTPHVHDDSCPRKPSVRMELKAWHQAQAAKAAAEEAGVLKKVFTPAREKAARINETM